jgi:tetratricopeptide (TPR) repeat protein
MSKIHISNIKDYKSLYQAYARLREEGNGTNSAGNAKAIFGQNVDIDNDGTAELWEFMQRANEANGRTIFDAIEPLKKAQDGRYPHISEDNPIRMVLSVEAETVGDEKAEAAYRTIDSIIETAGEKIRGYSSPIKKLKELYSIISEDCNLHFEATILLSEGLAMEMPIIDCDAASFIYLAVAHELNWPVYLAHARGHVLIFWKSNENENLYFETTDGEIAEEKYIEYADPRARGYIKNQENLIIGTTYHNRGGSYGSHGKYDLAEADLTRATELCPDEPFAYFNRGIVYHDSGKYDLAKSDFTRAIELDPAFAMYRFNRGDAYMNLAKLDPAIYNLAIMDYTRVIELDPNHVAAYNHRGAAYVFTGSYDLAIRDFTKIIIELDHGFADAYYNRAMVNDHLDNCEQYYKDMEMYLRLKK